jgi:hypothetical protein
MLTVITGLFQMPQGRRWFTTYDASWVDKLYRGFARNLSEEFRFVCLVDRDYGFKEPMVNSVPFERPDLYFMALNEIYRPDLGIRHGLFVGLDTIITGNLDQMVSGHHIFTVPRDPFQQGELCNAVVLFNDHAASKIWVAYQEKVDWWAAKCRIGQWAGGGGYPSEMMFLREVLNNNLDAWIDDLYPGQVLSYKVHMKKRGKRDPGKARIIYFHGHPKPSDVREPWVAEHWK